MTEKEISMTAKKQADALQVLLDDHKKVKALYERFEKLGDKDGEEKQAIIERTCKLLGAHTRLEEEVFYPAVRDKIKEPALIEEAAVEHQSAKDLIARLETEKLADERRDAVFIVLCEYVQHHVQEEEKELFPQVRKASSLDLEALGEAMVERKAELAIALDIGEEEAEPSKTRAAPRKRAATPSHAAKH
jgi:hemerythrin-like domain-containing protein